ncbi:MAG: YceI family protein [Pseudomonadota bacterium]
MATYGQTKSLHRYNSVAIILHWAMALGFFIMLGSGIAMTYFELNQNLKFQIYQWHKSGGVLLLLAFGLRISWRIISQFLLKQIPSLPEKLPKLEKLAAKLGHLGLYALMFALPLSGWVMVSSSVYGLPTIVFNWFQWPHIPGIQGNEMISNLSKNFHFYFAIAFGLMIFTHIAAVVKHAVKDKMNLMTRMWWSKSILKTALIGFLAVNIMTITISPSFAKNYMIDYGKSKINFSATHAGNEFTGQFNKWQAEIYFDSNDLASSFIKATFDLDSAKTGDAMYDGTLPQADWFDIKNHPTATFKTTSIALNADGSYQANGDLTIKSITKTIIFDFNLTSLKKQPVIVKAEIPIDRLAFDIGKKSDPNAEWVSRDIQVNLNITASAL